MHNLPHKDTYALVSTFTDWYIIEYRTVHKHTCTTLSTSTRMHNQILLLKVNVIHVGRRQLLNKVK